MGRRSGAGRYAPSPTGLLHAGNLRTALAAWASARAGGMHFLLRVEDIDRPRCKRELEARQLADLKLLGIDWDGEPIRQNERIDIYTTHFEALRSSGEVYPCFCSRKDIADALSAPHGPGSDAYPGTCRALPPDEAARRMAAGAQHCWRIRVGDAPKVFHDEFAGVVSIDLETNGGDFVIRRADGLFSYQFVCAVDDALTGVTEVVRADDLLDSGLRQAWILARLKLPTPAYRHIPLMHAADGRRLAKREGSDDLRGILSRGKTIDEVRGALAASLGQCDPGEPITMDELVKRWDWSRVPKAAAVWEE
ncbi:tRNA glutamyl-Q(34) synthetase GluQRS [Candidatus Sumerlaeota bacterium]|nr:tRNA glutamyl-Q(34) synthetase GluQRS [Candidatus Sumerlaeota bacterium]